MTPPVPPRPAYRGGPLIVLVMLVIGWVALRAVWWDDPFETPAAAFESLPAAYGYAPQSVVDPYRLAPAPPAYPPGYPAAYPAAYYGPAMPGMPLPPQIVRILHAPQPGPYRYAREVDLGLPSFPSLPPGIPRSQPAFAAAQVAHSAPFLPAASTDTPAPPAKPPGRWSLDYWSFYRQGSEAAPVSQGRVPIYGAS